MFSFLRKICQFSGGNIWFDSNPFYENRALLFGIEYEILNTGRWATLSLLWQLLRAQEVFLTKGCQFSKAADSLWKIHSPRYPENIVPKSQAVLADPISQSNDPFLVKDMNPLGSQIKPRNERGGQVTRRDVPLRLTPPTHSWIHNFIFIPEFAVRVTESPVGRSSGDEWEIDETLKCSGWRGLLQRLLSGPCTSPEQIGIYCSFPGIKRTLVGQGSDLLAWPLTTRRSLPSASTLFSASSCSRMVFSSSGAFTPLTTATSSPPWNTAQRSCSDHTTATSFKSWRVSKGFVWECAQGQGPWTPHPQPPVTSLPPTPCPNSLQNFLEGIRELGGGGPGP